MNGRQYTSGAGWFISWRKPRLGRRLLYAMQFVIIFIGSIVLVPMLAADDLGWGPEQVTFLLQCAIFTGGIVTFVQAKGLGPVGARLPILLGTTFVVITPLVAITTGYGYDAFLGAVIAGAWFMSSWHGLASDSCVSCSAARFPVPW